jgi:broad specificity phosphatase PhoE
MKHPCTVFVSRHGRTITNESHIIQNWLPYELSASGSADVMAARKWWATRYVDVVVSSPLRRAVLRFPPWTGHVVYAAWSAWG